MFSCPKIHTGSMHNFFVVFFVGTAIGGKLKLLHLQEKVSLLGIKPCVAKSILKLLLPYMIGFSSLQTNFVKDLST